MPNDLILEVLDLRLHLEHIKGILSRLGLLLDGLLDQVDPLDEDGAVAILALLLFFAGVPVGAQEAVE